MELEFHHGGTKVSNRETGVDKEDDDLKPLATSSIVTGLTPVMATRSRAAPIP